MSEKYHEDFHNYTKFWISEETYKVGEVKLKDSNRITGKYKGSARQECNIGLSKKKSLLCFVMSKIMIHILSFKILKKYNFEINVLPKTVEKYISFTIQQPKEKRQ